MQAQEQTNKQNNNNYEKDKNGQISHRIIQNVSIDTYDRQNVSIDTYNKQNMAIETYNKTQRTQQEDDRQKQDSIDLEKQDRIKILEKHVVQLKQMVKQQSKEMNDMKSMMIKMIKQQKENTRIMQLRENKKQKQQQQQQQHVTIEQKYTENEEIYHETQQIDTPTSITNETIETNETNETNEMEDEEEIERTEKHIRKRKRTWVEEEGQEEAPKKKKIMETRYDETMESLESFLKRVLKMDIKPNEETFNIFVKKLWNNTLNFIKDDRMVKTIEALYSQGYHKRLEMLNHVVCAIHKQYDPKLMEHLFTNTLLKLTATPSSLRAHNQLEALGILSRNDTTTTERFCLRSGLAYWMMDCMMHRKEAAFEQTMRLLSVNSKILNAYPIFKNEIRALIHQFCIEEAQKRGTTTASYQFVKEAITSIFGAEKPIVVKVEKAIASFFQEITLFIPNVDVQPIMTPLQSMCVNVVLLKAAILTKKTWVSIYNHIIVDILFRGIGKSLKAIQLICLTIVPLVKLYYDGIHDLKPIINRLYIIMMQAEHINLYTRCLCCNALFELGFSKTKLIEWRNNSDFANRIQQDPSISKWIHPSLRH